MRSVPYRKAFALCCVMCISWLLVYTMKALYVKAVDGTPKFVVNQPLLVNGGAAPKAPHRGEMRGIQKCGAAGAAKDEKILNCGAAGAAKVKNTAPQAP
eukprot:gene18062-biopygen11435